MKTKAIRNIRDHSSTLATDVAATVVCIVTMVRPRPPQIPSIRYSTGSRGVLHRGMALTCAITKPTYMIDRKAKTSVATNSPGTGDAHRARIIYIKPSPRKRETNINPREIQELFHPFENAILQALKGCPRKMRWKPPPSTPHKSQPRSIPEEL